MTEHEAIEIHIAENIHRIEVIEDFMHTNSDSDDAVCRKNISVLSKINGLLQTVQKYRAIGTVEEIKEQIAELERWHTDHVNKNIKNPFAWTSTLVCHNCDHKDDYIEELEAEIEKYHAIGTVEECRAAVEKQKEMKAYCDENTCAGCPYHNTSSKDNKCMNDFIADSN